MIEDITGRDPLQGLASVRLLMHYGTLYGEFLYKLDSDRTTAS